MNFTQDYFRVGKLLSGPTPTDAGCMKWGLGGFRSNWEGNFQARTTEGEGTSQGGNQEKSLPGRVTVSANTLVPGSGRRERGVSGVGRWLGAMGKNFNIISAVMKTHWNFQQGTGMSWLTWCVENSSRKMKMEKERVDKWLWGSIIQWEMMEVRGGDGEMKGSDDASS